MADLWCYKVSPVDISLPILGFNCFMHRGVPIYKCGKNVLWYLNQICFELTFYAYNLVQNKQILQSTILHERLREFSDADFSANIRNLLFRLGNIIIIWCLLSSEMALVMSIINLLWLYIMFIWKFNLIVSAKQIGNYFNNQFWCICLSFLCLPFTLIINSFLFSKNLTEIKTRNHSI